VDPLAGLQPLLALGDDPAAVAIGSNSTTCQPGVPADVVEACLAGDETLARARAGAAGSMATYPATKTGWPGGCGATHPGRTGPATGSASRHRPG
jgi:hypothetical protein